MMVEFQILNMYWHAFNFILQDFRQSLILEFIKYGYEEILLLLFALFNFLKKLGGKTWSLGKAKY